jgi:hypothetical protein
MAILIRQKRGMVEVPNVIINWALVASRGSVKYTKRKKLNNSPQHFSNSFCYYTVLSVVVTANDGHFIDGAGHLETVHTADGLLVGLLDQKGDEIQSIAFKKGPSTFA